MLKYLKKIDKIADDLDLSIYLVGGFVRNLLLKQPNDDIDFLVQGNPYIIAQKSAEALAGTFIVLDSERLVYRVAIKINNEIISFDFSGFENGRLVENLINRDFSINSMAILLKKYIDFMDKVPVEDIYDYTGGVQDIGEKLIKVNHKDTFHQDPLRMLRAFRLAAVYGLNLSKETLELIKTNVYLIKEVSGERIRDEIFKVLKCKNSLVFINLMWDSGLLGEIFPEIIELDKTEQNGYHSVNVWSHCLQAMASFENNKWKDVTGNYLNQIESYLDEEITNGRNKGDLLKFTLLFHDCGKPATKGIKDDGRITFYGHDEVGAKKIRKICDRLVLSTKEKEFVIHIIKHHMGPLTLFTLKNRSETAIRKFFRKSQPEALGILLHAYSDKNASRGSLQKREDFISLKLMIKDLIEIYFNNKLVQHYESILTGKELIAIFNLDSGPNIGKILTRLEEEYIKRGNMTKNEAINFCQEIISKNSMHKA